MSNDGIIGRHLSTFEEPDILFMRLSGPVTEEEGRLINQSHRDLSVGRDRLFFLVNLLDLESIHPSVRKEAGAILKDLPLRGAALFNASLKAKVVAKLILTAVNLFKSERDKMPIVFFPDEAEARRWIEGRRRELSEQAA